jgi:spore germination protein
MKFRARKLGMTGKGIGIAALAISGLLGLSQTHVLAADATQPFTDLAGTLAEKQITDLQQRGIVTGFEGKFMPNSNISRAEFVTMLDRTLQIKPVQANIAAFTDVKTGDWSYSYVQSAVQLGISNGTTATTFAPGDDISREQVAILLVRALHALDPARDIKTSFADAGLVHTWAEPYVAAASRLGLMNGYMGNFRPRDSITREEVAIVLDQLVQDPRFASALQASATTSTNQVMLSWQYGETTAQYEQRVIESNGMINTLSPRWFFLDSSGQFTDNGEAALVTWAHQNGKKIWPLIGNHFDAALTHKLLSSATTRTALVNQLMGYVQKYQLDGLNIDFERVDAADRTNLTAFATELATALHQNNKQLSIDVPPDFKTDWDACYDYTALAGSLDYLVLMGYDEHWYGDPTAGSVSSMPWLTKGVNTLIGEAPKSKVILGLPLYTADWYTQNGAMNSEDITLGEQSSRLTTYHASKSWDTTLGQYVASFSTSGVGHKIWVEDGRSLTLKYLLGLQTGVAGTAFWYEGSETSDIWTSLQNAAQYYNFTQHVTQ